MPPKKKLKKNQSTHLYIDISTDLFLTIKGIKGIFPSYLIGKKPDAFLIIKTPTIISDENLLSKGKSLMVRYTHLGDIYKFNTSILGENKEPFKVTYLSYPDVVDKIEYRDSPRVSSYIPASLLFKEIEVKGIVVDISVAGCKFRTDSIDQLENLLMKKEGDVTLKFPVLGLDGIRGFKGKIKKVAFDNDLALGIGFTEIEQDARNTIASYIESSLEYRGR
ncbi:MAG: flagellar brake protein [Deltaproteobacteria bacterium]|nr:flagellar brake protein [Deltaproteobacteria bacterium]